MASTHVTCDQIGPTRILGFVTSHFAIDVPSSLIERAAHGEMRAFEHIYRLFERPVYTLALRMLGMHGAAAANSDNFAVMHRSGVGCVRSRSTKH